VSLAPQTIRYFSQVRLSFLHRPAVVARESDFSGSLYSARNPAFPTNSIEVIAFIDRLVVGLVIRGMRFPDMKTRQSELVDHETQVLGCRRNFDETRG
jgi:hypothetical protein